MSASASSYAFSRMRPRPASEPSPALMSAMETKLVELRKTNGQLRQETSTADFIFPVYRLVSFISQVMTLLPGDVIATGTPSSIGPMQAGDEVEVRISGIGSLRNRVAAG